MSSGPDRPRVLDAADPAAVAKVAGVLAAGGVAALPTDTVYGLGARVDRPEGIGKLFRLKGRRREAAIAVLVRDARHAASMGLTSPRAARLAAAFWPGPLTIVVARPAGLAIDIGGDGRTVGLRMPDHPALLELLEATGPLATTSANRSGAATPPTAGGVAAVFGGAVDVYLDGGPSAGGPPSTVVSDVGEQLTVLREGSIPAEALHAAAGTGSVP